MHIPTEYQVAIGSSIGMLVLMLIMWIKDYSKDKERESQHLAFISIIFGLIIIVPFLSIAGLLLAMVSLKIKKNKKLSKIALIVNIIATLPWLAVLIFGA